MTQQFTPLHILTGHSFTGTKYQMFENHPELKPAGFNDIKAGRQKTSAGWTLQLPTTFPNA